MIHSAEGDLFTSTAQALVIPMALKQLDGYGTVFDDAQRKYPQAIHELLLRKDQLKLGGAHFISLIDEYGNRLLCFLPMREFRYARISRGTLASNLSWLRITIEKQKPQSIAFPALGCGTGGLLWKNVKPMLLQLGEHLDKLGMDVTLYEPWSHDCSAPG